MSIRTDLEEMVQDSGYADVLNVLTQIAGKEAIDADDPYYQGTANFKKIAEIIRNAALDVARYE